MMLSIIMPVYNEQKNLTKRLFFLSEFAHNYSLEIIVCDSPESTDNSKSVCNNYSKVSYFVCPVKGRAAQMNFGAKKASGEIYLFLHADVILPNDFYLQILTTLKNGFEAGFFAYQFDKKSILLQFNSYFTQKKGIFSGGGDQCQFFTKNAFKTLQGYDETFCIMEDFKMINNVRKLQIPYFIIQSKAIVSARKYQQHSWLKVNLINGYVFFKYMVGMHPRELRKTYKSLLREKL